MRGARSSPITVDDYIAGVPDDVRPILDRIRATIRGAAPEAQERISYGMPGYYLNGPLVYFGAHKNHIGFYPTPSGVEEFEAELSVYKRSKGSVQFPLDRPIPYDLIGRIAHYRATLHTGKSGA